jgi:hypothetical protein
MGNAGAPVQFYLRLRLQPPGRRVDILESQGLFRNSATVKGYREAVAIGLESKRPD